MHANNQHQDQDQDQKDIDEAIDLSGLQTYIDAGIFSNAWHQGRARALMTELRRTDLFMRQKRSLIGDQLSKFKFDGNKQSEPKQPYHDCPNALRKAFYRTPNKEEDYYKILLRLDHHISIYTQKKASASLKKSPIPIAVTEKIDDINKVEKSYTGKNTALPLAVEVNKTQMISPNTGDGKKVLQNDSGLQEEPAHVSVVINDIKAENKSLHVLKKKAREPEHKMTPVDVGNTNPIKKDLQKDKKEAPQPVHKITPVDLYGVEVIILQDEEGNNIIRNKVTEKEKQEAPRQSCCLVLTRRCTIFGENCSTAAKNCRTPIYNCGAAVGRGVLECLTAIATCLMKIVCCPVKTVEALCETVKSEEFKEFAKLFLAFVVANVSVAGLQSWGAANESKALGYTDDITNATAGSSFVGGLIIDFLLGIVATATYSKYRPCVSETGNILAFFTVSFLAGVIGTAVMNNGVSPVVAGSITATGAGLLLTAFYCTGYGMYGCAKICGGGSDCSP